MQKYLSLTCLVMITMLTPIKQGWAEQGAEHKLRLDLAFKQLSSMERDRVDLERQHHQLTSRHGPGHPKVQQMESELAFLSEKAAELRQTIARQGRQNVDLQIAQIELESLLRAQQQLRSEHDDTKDKLSRLSRRLAEVEKEIKIKTKRLQSLREQSLQATKTPPITPPNSISRTTNTDIDPLRQRVDQLEEKMDRVLQLLEAQLQSEE